MLGSWAAAAIRISQFATNFLASSWKDVEKERDWMDSCRRQYCKEMTTRSNIVTGNVLADLLEKTVLHLCSSPSTCFFPSTEYKGSLQEAFPGYDWLASTMFLVMSGDKDRALAFLLRFSRLLTSAFLWPPRLHCSVYLPLQIAQSGIHPIYSCTAHYVEMLLKAEAPLVFSAFRMSGFTPSQCFWNYLDWPEICHYIATCVVMGPDYQVYTCIAVLKHLQQDILQHTQLQDLQVFLKEEPVQGFRVSNYLEYMEGLEQRYRTVVLTDMRKITLDIT
ncbi:hypothetical protein JZ751_005061 [Albula glossodonta]|uniref:Protein broad-minded n=1 Tax=Albula glossodonta TaxID=121402 RepID=A0A8T2P4P8_9TELE|nr:hypothetical protein JZ751_005061 [Albula glossodonta]